MMTTLRMGTAAEKQKSLTSLFNTWTPMSDIFSRYLLIMGFLLMSIFVSDIVNGQCVYPTVTGSTICQNGNGSLTVTSSVIDSSGTTVKFPSSGAGWGGTSTNIYLNDNSYATTSVGRNGAASAVLNATGFGFSIPANATIAGVTVKIGKFTATSGIVDSGIVLIKSGVSTGINKSLGATWSLTNEREDTYGSDTAKWGVSLLPADVNASNFGVAIQAKNPTGTNNINISIDYVTITIKYTIPGSIKWYSVSSGGTSIASGISFNPVAVLSISSPGTYKYYAENNAYPNCRTEAIFQIDANTAITTQPIGGSFCSGSSFPLSVVATGTSLNYQWYRNGVSILTNGTLPYYTATEGGDYKVIVTGSCQSVTSSEVSVLKNNITLIGTEPTASSIICEGDSVRLEVGATGSGTLGFQWRKNGISIPGATSSFYYAKQSGNYTVIVNGACGNDTSALAEVSVKMATTINTEPSSSKLCADSTLTLSVTAVGDGVLTYQWYGLNGTIGTNSNSLQVTSTGSYYVIVTGGCSKDTSATAVITAKAPTTISIQPVGGKLCPDSSKIISVTASGEGTLRYQWYKGSSPISGAIASTYPVTSTGSYYVTVTGECGTVTSTAVDFTANAPTLITTQPAASSAICPGGRVTLTVAATGEGALQYQWYKNGAAIGGATGASYNATLDGTYYVRVTSTCGTIQSNNAVVAFKEVTAVISDITNAKLCADSSLTLSVTATGDGTLSYQWYKDNLATGGNSNSLTVTATGSYYVVVTGGCYKDSSSVAVITSKAPTAITVQPVGGKICLDSSKQIAVSATGEGTLKYQWYKNGSAISTAKSATYFVTSTGTYYVTVTGECGTVSSDLIEFTQKTATAITTQPAASTAICPSTTETLTVAATGEGTLSYQWKKNGVNILNANSASYVVNAAGTYTVVVTGECGSVTSISAIVREKTITSITTDPKDAAYCPGGTTTLSVVAQGEGLSYQWKIEGNAIPNATAATYAASAAGSYSVVVSGDCGTVESSAATVREGVSTTITSQPQSGEACPGNSVLLSVSASGEGLQYQWKNGSNAIANATASTYSASTSGNYSVVVTGNCGTVTSSIAVVRIKTATSITSQPQSEAICPGFNASLSVTAAGEGLNYQWLKNGIEIPNATLSTLSVSDSGSYQVRVTGDCGTVTSTAAVVRIKTVTAITAQPQSAGFCPSFTTNLSVTAVGEGLTYQWHKDEVIIPNATSSTYTTGTSGSYKVFVSGDCDAVYSNPAVVTVKAPTVITSQPTGGAICSGQSITLNVSATGEGTVTYQWKKGGVNITNANSSSYVATDAGTYTVAVTGECGTLTSNNAIVSFSTPTTVTTQPTAKTITYGDNTSFSASGSGFGTVSYQWQVKPLNGSWTDIVGGSLYSSPTAATLNLTTPAVSQNGNLYRCMISGTCGDVFTNEVSLTVNKATLTVRAQDKTKAYGASMPALTDSISGFKNNENSTTSGVISGSSSITTTATELSNVGSYPLTISSGSLTSDNYAFNFVNGTLTVTPATLTVTADNLNRTYASSNPALTYQYSGFVQGQSIGATSGVTGTPSLTTTAVSSSYAGSYPITITKGTLVSASNNYTFTFVNGNLTVNKAVVSVTANNKTRFYGTADSAYTATYSGFLLSDAYGTAGGVNGTPSFSSSNSPKTDAGTYSIIPSVGSLTSPNYSFVYNNGTLTVLKATLTVKANNKSRIYGLADTAYTAAYSGFVNGETFETSGISGTPVFSTGTTLKSIPGSYTITPAQGSLTSTNYFFSYSTGTLTISKAPLSVNADSTTKLYGAAVPPLTISYVGFMNGETISSGSDVTGTASLSTTARASSNVGTYPITFSTQTLTSTNYLITYKTSNLSVTKAPLTVAADTLSKAYGAALPALTYKVTGLVNNDNANSYSGTPVLSTTALISSPVGNYPITPTQGTLAAANYNFVMQNGVLRVNKVSLTITADAKSRVYGASDPTFTVRITGFVNGDSLATSDVQGAPSFTTNAKDTSRVGTYTITPALGTLASNNYSFGPFNTGVLTITKANLTVKADTVTKAYGSVNPTLTYTFNGFANNETYGASSGVTGTPVLATAVTAATVVGTYPVTISVGTLTSINYNFIMANGGLRVTKATLNVTAQNASRVYGAANPTFSVRFSGFKNGDTTSTAVTGLVAISTSATADSAVGNYAIVPALGTLSSNNYAFNFINGTLTVSKAVITVKADNKSRLYGQLNPDFTATYTGFLNKDSLSVLSGQPDLSTLANERSIPANYSINAALGTLSATNYSFSFQNGTLSVGKALLVASADNKSKKYGDSNPPLTITYNGFVNGDSISGTVITGTPSISTQVNQFSPVGTQAITLTAGSQISSYYSISYQNGVFDIQKSILKVKATDLVKTYGETNPNFAYTFEGFKNNEQAGSGVVTGSPVLNTTATTLSDAGTYPITIDSGSLSAANYLFEVVNGTMTIGKKKLTVTANSETRKYGQSNPQFTASYSGFISGQDKLNSDVTGDPSITSTTDEKTGVGTYDISIDTGSLKSTNYFFELVKGNINITKTPLKLTADSKRRAFGAANPVFTVTYTGFVNGEDFASSQLIGEPQLTTSAGAASPVGSYPITFVPYVTSSANYELSYESGTLTIGKAELTVTAENKFKTYGQQNPALTYSVTGYMNTDDAAVLTGSPLLSTGAGNNSGVGNYPILIDSGNLQATNYSFRFVPGVLAINKASITVTANNDTRKYGAANPIFSATYTGFITGQDKASSDIQGQPSLTTIADAKSSVGDYTIQIDTGTLSSNNYSFNFVSGNIKITPASLKIIADNKTKTYGQNNPALTYTFSGFVNNEVQGTSDLIGTPVLTTTATTGSGIGNYPITFVSGQVSSTNYALEFVNGTLAVGKTTLTVTADSKTKVYGQANPVLTYQFSGFVNGEDINTPGVITGALTISTTATVTSNVNNYPITISQGTMASSNYNLSFVSSTLSVTKATLNVVALDTSRAYGGTNPIFKVRYDGFITGQTLATSDVSGSPTITTTASSASPAGPYDITPSQSGTLYSNNYAFNFVKGTLTVTKLNLIVAAQTKTRIYGAPDTGFAVTYSGFVNGDNINSLSGAPGFTTNATAKSAPGAYNIVPNVGTLQSANYNFVGFTAATLTITKAPLIVYADSKSRFYGGVTPTLTATYSGLMNGETFATSGITGAPTLSQSTTNKSNVGTYPISITAGNLASANYSFSSFVNGVLTIDKAPLNVTADNKSKNYGAANPALTYTITGLVNGENLNNGGISGTPVLTTDATTTSSAGNYDITPTQGSLAATNYSFVMVKGVLAVNKLVLTVTAQAKTRIYGAPDTGFTVTYSGFVNGDNASVISGTPSFTTNATAKSAPGNYTITPAAGSLSALSYTFGTFNTGTLTITKAPLTVKADNKNKFYGSANPALTISYIGLMNGETFATSGITGTATVATTATSNSVVSVNGYPITFATQNYASANYSFTYSSGTLTVDKAVLNVTANNATRAYGSANPAFTYGITGYVLNETSSVLTGAPVLTTDAIATSPSGNYDIVPTNGTLAASNYSFNFVKGILTVGKGNLIVTAENASRAYGASDPVFTVKFSGFVAGDSVQSSGITGAPSFTTSATAKSSPGNYTITPAQGTLLSDKYNFTFATGTMAVTKANLTVKANDIVRAYGDANGTLGITYEGFGASETLGTSDVKGTPAVSTTATPASGVGNYAITVGLGSLTSANYNFLFANGSVNVQKALLTVTAESKSRRYGSANPALTYKISGYKNNDSLTAGAVTGMPVLSTTADSTSPINTYAIKVDTGSLAAANYTFNLVNGTLAVNKALLTIRAENKSRLYGEAAPALTYAMNGFVNGENTSNLLGEPSISSSVSDTSGAGTYDINISGGSLSAMNYEFSFAKGTYTIGKATLTVYAEDKSRYFGESNPRFTARYEGFVRNETLATSDVTGDPDLTTTATSGTNVGTYMIRALKGTLSSRKYDFTFVNGNLSISKAVITIIAQNQTKKYGEVNPRFTITYGGFINGETADSNSITGSPLVTTPADEKSTVGSYPITVDTGTLQSINYDFRFTSGTLTVGKALLQVTPANKTKIYGDANPALTAVITGFVNNESGNDTSVVSGAAALSTLVTDTTGAGTYAISSAMGTLRSRNYDFNFTAGSFTVEKAELLVIANDTARTYGDANPAFTSRYSGFKNSDGTSVKALDGNPYLRTLATQTSNAGDYAITVGVDSLQSRNYRFTAVNGKLTIRKATLTVKANDTIRIYGETNPVFTATYNGFKNGDNVNTIGLSGSIALSTVATQSSEVGDYPITTSTSGLSSTNYLLTGVNGQLTIGKATLTVKAKDTSRIYGEANPTFTALYNGFKNGDIISTIGLSGAPGMATSAVVTSETGTYPITTTTGNLSAKNYLFTAVNGQLTIGKATLTVKANDTSRTYGEANPIFTASYNGFKNSDNIHTIELSGAVNMTTDAIQSSNAGVYTISASASGMSSKNYLFTALNGQLTVGKATLTVKANDTSRTYGDANPIFTASYNGFKNSDNINTIGLSGAVALSTGATQASNAGVYPITASANGMTSQNYLFTAVNGQLTVGKAMLTVKAKDTSRIYGEANPTFTALYNGFKNSDNITSIGLTGSLSLSTDATVSSNAGVYPITAATADLTARNYLFTAVNGQLTVGKATLTVKANDTSRTYGEANPIFTASYNGFKNADNIHTIGLSGAVNMSTDAIQSSNAGVYTISASASGMISKNYLFTALNGQLTVDKATLTVKANDTSRTYGDVNPIFTASYNGFKNSDNINTIGLSGIVALSTGATESSNAGVYPITASASGMTSQNYLFTAVNGQLTVGKAMLTVRAGDTSRIYGEANPTFKASYSGFRNSDNIDNIGLTGSLSLSTDATVSSNAGVYPITAATADLTARNYLFTAVNGQLTVGKATLTVKANDTSRTYGEANPIFTASYNGFKNADNINTIGLSGAINMSTDATQASDAGVYPITASASGMSSKNYLFTALNGQLTVGKATLTVKANDTSRTYGDANPTFTASYSGFKNSDQLSSIGLSGTPGMTTAATVASEAGTYPISTTTGNLSAKNYLFTAINGQLTVGKATLTLKANDTSRTYGEANPVFTATYSGFRNNDNISSIGLSGMPSLTTNATATSDAGNYDITASAGSLTSKNYVFAAANGTLTIGKAMLTVQAKDTSRTYGENNPVFTASYNGFKNSDNINTIGLTGSITISTEATPSSEVGIYPITASASSMTCKNYLFTAVNGQLTVGKATLTVKANDTSRTYGDANPTFTASYNGFKNSDNINTIGLSGAVDLSTGATEASNAGVYPITASASGMTSKNYLFTAVNGQLTIGKAMLTVKANDTSRTYGEANPTFTANFNGFKNADNINTIGLSGAPGMSTVATAGSDAGTYAITTTTGDLSSKNYLFTALNGQLTVGKATLTVKANDTSRVYGEVNPVFTASYIGFKNNDNITNINFSGTPSLGSIATESSVTGVYAITASANGMSAKNYLFTAVNGQLTVGKATLTVKANDASRTYGDANPTLTASYSGFKNADNITTIGLSGEPTLATIANEASDAGEYAITAGTGNLSSKNYQFVAAQGKLTIDKATLTVKADSLSRSYGEVNPEFTVSLTGFRNNDTKGTIELTGSPELTTEATATSAVGVYTINTSLGNLASKNYVFTPANGHLTVNKAVITVKANDTTKIFGRSNPAFTVSLTGFKNGETLNNSGVTGKATLVSEANENSIVGNYPISITESTLSSTNYTFTYADGTLSVTKAEVRVIADNKKKVYGAVNPLFTVTYEGLASGQTFETSGITGKPTLSTLATDTSRTGNYVIKTDAGNLASDNYSFVLVNGTLNIGKATLTVTADDKNRKYGQPNPSFTASYQGFITGQTVSNSGITGIPSFATLADSLSSTGNYDITVNQGSLQSDNYAFVFVKGKLSIGKTLLTIKANDVQRTYGQPDPEFIYTLNGFVNGQSLANSGISGSPEVGSGTSEYTPAGIYDIIADQGTMFSDNYDFAFVNGKLTINKAILNLKVTDVSRAYGSANPDFTYSLSGFVNGEAVEAIGLEGAPQYSTTANVLSKAGNYPVTADTGTLYSSNYKFSFTAGNLTVTKAIITVTADNKNKKYGEAIPQLTAQLAGFVNGETLENSGITGTPKLTTTANDSSDLGTYPIAVDKGSLAADNYDFATVAGELFVGKGLIQVKANNVNRVYGQDNPVFTASYSGFVNGDNINSGVITGAPKVYSNTNKFTGSYTFPIFVELGTLASSKYDFELVNGELFIAQAPITVKVDSISKTYGSDNPQFTFSYSGYVLGQNYATSGISGTPVIQTDATTISTVGDYAVITKLGTLRANNYKFVFEPGNLRITKAPLTVTVNDASRTYGDPNPAFSSILSGYVLGQTAANSGVTGTPVYTTTAVATSGVSKYPINAALGSLSAANYDFIFVAGELSVNKALITVTPDPANRKYGEANPVFTASYNGYKNGENFASSGITGAPRLYTLATASSPIGNYPINSAPGDLSAANYYFDYKQGNLIVGKATITVKADNKVKVYGAALPAFSVTYNGFQGSDNELNSSFTGQLQLGTTATASSNAGTYPITVAVGTLSAPNYDFAFSNGVLTVDKAVVNVIAENKSRTYGVANPSFTARYEGFVLGQNALSSGITGTPDFTTEAVVSTPTGQYPIKASTGSLSSGNYSFNFINGTLSINKATLSVIAQSKSKVYGDANPALTYVYSGFVNEETLATSGVTGQPVITTTVTSSAGAGLYDITLAKGTLTSSNYDFDLVNGSLFVDKATLSVTADNKTRLYGQNNPVFTATIEGFVNNETQATAGLLGQPSLTSAANSGSNVGTYPILATAGTLASANYNFVYKSGTLTVDKASLMITADNKSRTYGIANPALTVTYSGFVNGDNLNVNGVSGQVSISTAATPSSKVGSYPITLSQGTFAAGNYNVQLTNGTLAIDKATVKVIADSKSKLYGEAMPSLTVSYVGLMNGESKETSDITGTPVIRTSANLSSVVDLYDITIEKGTLASGNYLFTYENGTLLIRKAILSVTADPQSRTYGTANPVLTATISGFVNGETLATSGVSGTPLLTTAATALSDIGTYPISVAKGTLAAANYSFNYFSGGLSVLATNCNSTGMLAVSDACYGSVINLTYFNTVGTGPFTLVINDSVFSNVTSGVPFSSGVTSKNAAENIWDASTAVGAPVADNAAIEVGVKFRPNVEGEISGIRFYKHSGNTGTHIGSLWSSDGRLLATATFINETSSGWQQVNFSTPVPVTPGVTYIASYYAPNGNYAYTSGGFVSKRITNNTGSLTTLKASDGGNGVFKSGGGFPSEVSADNGNYHVDVVFNNTKNMAHFNLTGIVSANGCATNSSSIYTVEVNMSTFYNVVISQQGLECVDNTSGSVTLQAFGCNGPFTYSNDNGKNYQSGGTFSNLPAGQYTFKVKDATNFVRDTTVTIGVETARWTGAVNSDWHTPENWSTGKVPTAKTHVVIPVTVNECVVSIADISVASIQVQAGATLRVLNERKTVVTGKCAVLPQ